MLSDYFQNVFLNSTRTSYFLAYVVLNLLLPVLQQHVLVFLNHWTATSCSNRFSILCYYNLLVALCFENLVQICNGKKREIRLWWSTVCGVVDEAGHYCNLFNRKHAETTSWKSFDRVSIAFNQIHSILPSLSTKASITTISCWAWNLAN